jgi:sarcosine oxidase subunit beta
MEAETVILAAGIQSKDLGQTIGLDIPIVHRRKYVLNIEGFAYDFPVIMEVPTGWYIKKEGAQALIGMSGKEEKIDYEKQSESEEETIEASLHRFPETEKSGIKKVISSLSDETPDKHAIIDHSISGLIIATGFSGHGFMHSPAVGKVVTSLIKGEKPVLDISELKLKREHIKENIAI